mgnify:CR=1 FL=1
MDIRFFAAAAILPLAACSGSEPPVESTPPPPAEMTCTADAAASYVGQTATATVHLIVTPEYLRHVTEHHPEVQVYALRLDRGLLRARRNLSDPPSW